MLKKVTIPEGIDELHVATFYECTNLQTVELPASLTEVSYLAFMGCDNLANISIEKNSKYHSADNCLIETDTKTLIVGAANSVIPSDGSVETIGENAFYERAALSTIVIPDSVKNIGKLAFSGCTALRYVRMTGIRVIGERAFSGCRAIKYLLVSNELQSIEEYALSQCNTLRTIYMKGNAADWEKVSCAQTVESALEKITVYYYSETEPETEGNFWHFEKGDVISPWIKSSEK
jgi:hypothetical protein